MRGSGAWHLPVGRLGARCWPCRAALSGQRPWRRCLSLSVFLPALSGPVFASVLTSLHLSPAAPFVCNRSGPTLGTAPITRTLERLQSSRFKRSIARFKRSGFKLKVQDSSFVQALSSLLFALRFCAEVVLTCGTWSSMLRWMHWSADTDLRSVH